MLPEADPVVMATLSATESAEMKGAICLVKDIIIHKENVLVKRSRRLRIKVPSDGWHRAGPKRREVEVWLEEQGFSSWRRGGLFPRDTRVMIVFKFRDEDEAMFTKLRWC